MRQILAACFAIYALYVPTALWLDHVSSAPVRPPGTVDALVHFHRLTGDRFALTTPAIHLRQYEDDEPNNQHSPVLLYEDDKPLAHPHSSHRAIAEIGAGRYSHWKDIGFVFSTSDNSDPETNGRHYWAVLPDTARK